MLVASDCHHDVGFAEMRNTSAMILAAGAESEVHSSLYVLEVQPFTWVLASAGLFQDCGASGQA